MFVNQSKQICLSIQICDAFRRYGHKQSLQKIGRQQTVPFNGGTCVEPYEIASITVFRRSQRSRACGGVWGGLERRNCSQTRLSARSDSAQRISGEVELLPPCPTAHAITALERGWYRAISMS